MTQFVIDRRQALGAFGAAAALGVSVARPARAQSLDKVSFMTNWRAQAEHGGFYLAVTNGIYKKYGIECELRMGGPQQNASQLLLGGVVDMIMSNGFEAVNYAQQNLPFLCIGAIFQKDPQILMSHMGVGNDTLPALKGKPIFIATGARTSYWPYLRQRYGYTDEQIRPYTFNAAPFLADKTASQQGFITNEPFELGKLGVTPVIHFLADNGYANYQTTINVSRKMMETKKDLVQRFMTASLEGWELYMKGGPTIDAANQRILADNPDMKPDVMANSLKVMNDRGLVRSGDALKLGIGAMTDARWKDFYDSMVGAGVFPAGLDIKKAYSLDFVNKGVGA